MINLESIKKLLKSVPPDLIIISEDKETLHTHKLFVGLLSDTLANIFLEPDFIGETVSLHVPRDSKTLIRAFSSPGKEGTTLINAVFSETLGSAEFETSKFDSFKIEVKGPQHDIEEGEIDFGMNTIESCEDNSNEFGDLEKNATCVVRIPIKKKGNYKRKKIKRSCQSPLNKEKEGDVCPTCTLFIQSEKIVPHMIACKQKQEEPERKKVKCPLCNKNVIYGVFLYMHYYKCSNWTIPGSEKKRAKYEASMDRQNALLEEPTACSECDKMFFTKLSLKCHMRHHELQKVQKEVFHCDKCEFKTVRIHTLKLHKISRHTAAVYVTCELCGTKLKNSPAVLRQHKMYRHSNHEMINCEECGKQIRKVSYKSHIKKVHGERKHACHLCSYKAQSSYNLKLHISKSHLGLKEIPKEKCQYCDVVATNIPLHMKDHHPEI